EQSLPAEPVGHTPGGEVRERLAEPEGDDEREDRRRRAQAELVPADERKHAPLEADQGPDKQVQGNEQRELARVRTQPEPHALRHATAPTSPARLAATIRSCPAGL